MSKEILNFGQMLVIGGIFPGDQDCDAPNQYGTHNLNLGANGPANSKWDLFFPNITTYQVPPDIIAKIGGEFPIIDRLLSTNTFYRWSIRRSHGNKTHHKLG